MFNVHWKNLKFQKQIDVFFTTLVNYPLNCANLDFFPSINGFDRVENVH